MKKLILFLILALILHGGLAQASSIGYLDRGSWETAVGNFKQETFDSLPLNSDITIWSTHGGHVDNGLWTDTVGPPDNFGFGNSASSFSFSNPINAFGADWYTSGDFSDPPLLIFFGQYIINLFGQFSGQFIGVVASEAFSTFAIDAPFGSTTQIAYSIDNLVYPNTPSSVPEPSTFLLLGVGLSGLVLLRRRPRKQ